MQNLQLFVLDTMLGGTQLCTTGSAATTAMTERQTLAMERPGKVGVAWITVLHVERIQEMAMTSITSTVGVVRSNIAARLSVTKVVPLSSCLAFVGYGPIASKTAAFTFHSI